LIKDIEILLIYGRADMRIYCIEIV